MHLLSSLVACGLLPSLVFAQGNADDLFFPPDTLSPTEPDTQYSYPSPNATGIGGWDVAIAKAKRFIAQLTIEEKVSLCTGNGFP